MNKIDEFLLEHFGDTLAHAGVKGMKWGVRKARPSGVSRRTNRDAAKDAKEFARAKQFYGEGAGTRRKLIKAKVEGKSKRDPSYKKAFDTNLARQDTSKHASKAVSERRRKNVAKSTKQTTGAVARRFTGEMGTKAAFVALAAGGIAFTQSPRGQALMKKGVDKLRNLQQSRAGRKIVTDFLKG